MGLHFRPLPGLTLASLVGLAILIALGTWQMQRLEWKTALIATMEGRLAEEPVSLDTALALDGQDRAFRPVTVTGRFDHGRELFLFAQGRGGPGAKVVTPMVLDDGRTVLVDRGFVPQRLLDAAERQEGQTEGLVSLTGALRPPSPLSAFTPPADPETRMVFARDLEAMAGLGGDDVMPGVLIEAGPLSVPGGWPRAAWPSTDLSNRHLEYALTWYALALVLCMVYLAYHAKAGRLGLR
jgi:surfeit locus 1 family protein